MFRLSAALTNDALPVGESSWLTSPFCDRLPMSPAWPAPLSGVFGNAHTPLNGAGQAGDIGNLSQNGDVSQLDSPTGNASFVSAADNLNIPATGAGQAGVVGNAAQNGNVSQVNTGPAHVESPATPNAPESSAISGFGSAVNLFRNVRVPVDGAGQ